MPQSAYLGAELSGIQKMHPAYFASVMATGILALASDLMALAILSLLLTWLNIGLYVALCCCNRSRIAGTSGRVSVQ